MPPKGILSVWLFFLTEEKSGMFFHVSGSSIMMCLDIFDKITRHKKFEVLKINFPHKYIDHSQILYDEFCPEQKIFSV